MLRIAFRTALAAGLLVAVATAANAATIKVTISKLKFEPATVTAKAGDTIEWTNKDSFQHTATDKAGSFDVPLPPNSSGKTVVGTAGKIDYFCKIHPMMKGEITVAP